MVKQLCCLRGATGLGYGPRLHRGKSSERKKGFNAFSVLARLTLVGRPFLG